MITIHGEQTRLAAEDPNISHGRGGAANIGPGNQPDAEGEIGRQKPVDDQGDGAYSASVCFPASNSNLFSSFFLSTHEDSTCRTYADNFSFHFSSAMA